MSGRYDNATDWLLYQMEQPVGHEMPEILAWSDGEAGEPDAIVAVFLRVTEDGGVAWCVGRVLADGCGMGFDDADREALDALEEARARDLEDDPDEPWEHLTWGADTDEDVA